VSFWGYLRRGRGSRTTTTPRRCLGCASPYLPARVGNYSSYNDEGPDPDYRYVTLGAGMEYAGDGGFTAWADLGPALIDGERGW